MDAVESKEVRHKDCPLNNNCLHVPMKIKRLLCLFPLFATLSAQGAWALPDNSTYRTLSLHSNQAIVVDQSSGRILYAKNADARKPIASITKLMTAMVTLDAKLPLDQKIRITKEDIDTLRNSRSRLQVGPFHSRRELLQLALMSSENRAASALARSYPGGRTACIAAMNRKAKKLGMTNTRFADPTGLNSANVSTARDLVKMVQASLDYKLIRAITTTMSYDLKQGRMLRYRNTNPLFLEKSWQIGLSKTGYIKPAGHCLVMQTEMVKKPLIIVLLDASRRISIARDSRQIKQWVGEVLAASELPLTASVAISAILKQVKEQ